MTSLINKAKKPKFELHLTIYDLNNAPLTQGTSMVKWSFPHSMHAEHHGRTEKCPIDRPNHRVVYNYSKIIPVRIGIDRNSNLTEYPIDFEVIHEFPSNLKDEKITLGYVRVNLSEYVEESENYNRRRSVGAVGASRIEGSLEQARERAHGLHLHGGRHRRSGSGKPSNGSVDIGNTEAPGAIEEHNEVTEEFVAEEGIVRRYLMHEGKINSTLKVGILMVQVDGDRNYSAPPLKSAPIFGGIAGVVADQDSYSLPALEPSSQLASTSALGDGASFSTSGSHDAHEHVDMYRRALAASWSCQPGELPAYECIEDVFSGGDGWKDPSDPTYTPSSKRFEKSPSRRDHRRVLHDDESNTSTNTSGSGSPSEELAVATLRPSDARRIKSHMRQRSAGSDRSNTAQITVTNIWGRTGGVGDDSSGLGIPNGSYGHTSRHRGRYHRYPTSIPSAPTRETSSTENSAHDIDHDSTESYLRDGGFKPDFRPLRGVDSLHHGGGLGGMGVRLSGASGRNRREGWEEDVREDSIAWKLPGTVK